MLTNLSTILAHPLFQILKKYTYESQNTWHNFLLIPFFKYQKRILTNLSTVLAHPLFHILKKAYLQISKYLAEFFVYSLFQRLKENSYKS